MICDDLKETAVACGDGVTGATGVQGPTRRALLAASAATLPVLLTACKGVQSLGTPPAPPRDIVLLRDAISAEQLMVARYLTASRQLTGPG